MRVVKVLLLALVVALVCQFGGVSAAPKVNVPDYATATLESVTQLSFYDLLGVSWDADTAAIRKAFRTISLQQHPDKAKTDEERKRREGIYPRFTLASDTLTDELKRRSYDHLIHELGRHPSKITSHDIETAWDKERNMWASDRTWAPLSLAQSTYLVLFLTLAAFLVPFAISLKDKWAKAERAAALKKEKAAKLVATIASAKDKAAADAAKKAATTKKQQ